MAEFKCISCGEIKQGEEISTCPVCGYRMFQLPYERKNILRNEILNFLHKLQLTEIDSKAFDWYREEAQAEKKKAKRITKAQDDERFPNFKTVQGYVCNVSRTEQFCERFTESIAQLRTHIGTDYQREYVCDLAQLQELIATHDEALSKALAVLGVSCNLPHLQLPQITLDYSERPNTELMPSGEALLTALDQLVLKLLRFIKQNNIYGSVYRDRPESMLKCLKNVDFTALLADSIAQVELVLRKNYMVDLLSDGSEELAEILRALWNGMEAAMKAPLLTCSSLYTFGDGAAIGEAEFAKQLTVIMTSHYAELNAVLASPELLSSRDEGELFSIYNHLIEIDEFGILQTERGNLLRVGESEEKLAALTGLSSIKESVRKIKAYALMNKDSDQLNIHMCFLGNPGCGKTEVARILAGILHESKVLPTAKVVEVDRSGLVSEYFGATAEKTRRVIASAMGGVLFIDEAYALGNNSDSGITDYGREAIDTLVKAMEDSRGKFCVILAGYRNEMLKMLSTNPGFKSRIQFILDFPNYSRDELQEIAKNMLQQRNYVIGEAALSKLLDITDIRRKDPNFANARELRNILDQVIMCQNLRCVGTHDNEIGLIDVNQYIHDSKLNLPMDSSDTARHVMTGEEELDQLVGLSAVKRMVRKIKAYARRNVGLSDFNLHMCFYGNPGTGKTQVARIISRILYDAGVLSEAKLVETDAHGLIGRYVGETGPRTLAKLDEAMGGVLFIDEAYILSGESAGNMAASYGDEAIAVLLKEMEDRRGQFCVILAGYRDEMQQMLNRNPGFESRIQFTLEFPDYTREELGLIAHAFLRNKQYEIADDALTLLLDITEYYRARPNFANARTVRNILDQVIMNQNLRTEDMPGDCLITVSDVEDYLIDEGIDINSPTASGKRIGFS